MRRAPILGLAAIFAGGFAGAIARVALAESVAADPTQWPRATFAANVAGALVLGYVAERVRDPRRRLLLATGFCGALTTFSGFGYQTVNLLAEGDDFDGAVANVGVSVVLGFAACSVGWFMG
jgi:CrcB protein